MIFSKELCKDTKPIDARPKMTFKIFHDLDFIIEVR